MKAQVEQNWLDCLLACAAHAVNMEEPNCREWSFGSNRDYHPIFYGCYDWHSAVHSHWLMAHSLVHFPSELPGSAAITRNTLSKETVQKTRELLITRLTAQNAQKELNTIRSQYPEDWEMPYGVAWFFKLRIALHDLSKIYTDLLPAFNSLENLDAHFRYLVQFWLKSITSPITNGKHDNTAFALSFILEYARHFRHDDLEHRIQHFCEKHFFPKRDLRDPPAYYDFLSPSLSVYELVSRFGSHPSVFDLFPQLSFPLSLFPIVDLDGENGQPCHLIGLNFARCWGLAKMYKSLKQSKVQEKVLRELREKCIHHFQASQNWVCSGKWMTDHWICTFALIAYEELVNSDLIEINNQVYNPKFC